MPRLNDSVVRVDFRCPIEVHDAIEALATAKGNRVNHKSGRVEISSTVLDLIKIGLLHSSDSLPDSVSDKLTGKFTPPVSDKLIGEIVDRVVSVTRPDSVSDNVVSDKLIDEIVDRVVTIVSDNVPGRLSDISDNLTGQLSDNVVTVDRLEAAIASIRSEIAPIVGEVGALLGK